MRVQLARFVLLATLATWVGAGPPRLEFGYEEVVGLGQLPVLMLVLDGHTRIQVDQLQKQPKPIELVEMQPFAAVSFPDERGADGQLTGPAYLNFFVHSLLSLQPDGLRFDRESRLPMIKTADAALWTPPAEFLRPFELRCGKHLHSPKLTFMPYFFLSFYRQKSTVLFLSCQSAEKCVKKVYKKCGLPLT